MHNFGLSESKANPLFTPKVPDTLLGHPIPSMSQSIYNYRKILCIGTDRSQQTAQTKIRLLLKKQSDQDLRWLPFHQHLLEALMQCYINLFYFKDNYGNCLRCPKF